MHPIIYFKTLLFELIEQRKVARRYYASQSFSEADKLLKKRYIQASPYRISSLFLKEEKAEDPHVYGETPLTTVETIVKECEIKAQDRVLEMGLGRGRVALFLAAYVGCKVKAYEHIPAFVENMVTHDNLQVVCQDFQKAPFEWADVIYLYGTMLEDRVIDGLCDRFPKKTKIITPSYPLCDYSKEYQTKKTFEGRFPWGKTQVYWNERI